MIVTCKGYFFVIFNIICQYVFYYRLDFHFYDRHKIVYMFIYPKILDTLLKI